MGKYVALLRGINVGGHRKLPMKRLVPIFEGLGCARVSTYIQSGNVVFEAEASLAKRIPKLVADTITEDFRFNVPIVIRSAAQLRKAVADNPFAKPKADPKSLYVAFLVTKPTKAASRSLDPERSPPDRFEVLGREVFLHLPKGAGKTKLTNDYLEKKLGVASTVRNWRTCGKLLLMLE